MCLALSSYLSQKWSLAKKRKAALKKCVTFSDEVVLVACAEEEEDDYVPNPLLERVYRQHAAKQDYRECPEPSQLEDISSVHSSDSCDSVCHADAVNDSSQVPCNLCHKKFVSPPTVYCPDCAFYMSRFQKTDIAFPEHCFLQPAVQSVIFVRVDRLKCHLLKCVALLHCYIHNASFAPANNCVHDFNLSINRGCVQVPR
ncbi:hypothetical protein HPB48_021877 [Haemaphysalis longicornis]|uniref:Uncharacterized protein n=1 Tax=Haemaphysalis longicornis TaxID=44386 RepID=A0A9J6FEQ1_HAELO|nr:hypothetical protein HPB48_021877 [Haemaphysalis longicornis]